MATEYYARRGNFFYGDLRLDVGQILGVLKGERNDAKMLDLGILAPVAPGVRPVQCGKCGGRFIADGMLNMHGRARHDKDDPVTLDERLDRLNDQLAPAMLDTAPLEVSTPRPRSTRSRGATA